MRLPGFFPTFLWHQSVHCFQKGSFLLVYCSRAGEKGGARPRIDDLIFWLGGHRAPSGRGGRSLIFCASSKLLDSSFKPGHDRPANTHLRVSHCI
jgi:hypothetical protein